MFEETNEWVAAYERVSRMLSYFKKTEELYFNYDAKGHPYKVRMGKRTLDRTTSRLLIKPLTAALNVPKLIGARSYTILMSATLGDPAPLAKELGFKEYDFASYPHPIPAKYRPVFDLGFERMTWANLSTRPILYKLQAFKVADWVKTLPKEWRGMALTSSYDKASKLRAGLKETAIADRLFEFGEGLSVTERINQFYENKEPGKIAVDISYGWGHGISFSWDKARFVVVGSVPFGEFNDPFQKVRRDNVEGAEDFAWWTAYTSVPQICGRVSRGEVQPDGVPLLNVAALADGSATSSYAKRYYPSWFRESIVEA
jgi:Rad3-related DNA helicase